MANTGKKNYTGVPFGSNLYMVNPRYHNNFSTITYNGSTYPIKNILNLDKGNNAIEVEWDNDGTPTREWIRPTTDFWAAETSQEPVYNAGYVEEVPVSTYVDTLVFPDYIDYDVSRDAALGRTDRVYSNYASAKDNPLSKSQETLRNALRYLKDNVYEGIPAGISNCTLTASQWIDPLNPVKNASSIVSNPAQYGYTPISQEDAIPGDLVIAKVPNEDSYHTMLISGFANDDGAYRFGDTFYEYSKGEPLVTYSRGGHDPSFIRRDVPLSVYTANSDGHTENQYYRYNYPNEVFLPEVTIKGGEHAYGGPLVQIANRYEIGGPKKKNIAKPIGLTPWPALSNIEYEAIADPTFTRDKTGEGSIEYFAPDEEGIQYNNGYYREHPMFGHNVILYDPNTNDEQDIRLDTLHAMPQDSTYDVLNTIYRDKVQGSDVAYNALRRYKEAEDILKKQGQLGKDVNPDPYPFFFNNEADGLLRNMFIEGTPEYIESKRYHPNKQQLRECNEPLMPYVDAIQQYLETNERPQNVLEEVVVEGNKHSEGGSLNTHKKWEDLSMKERGEMIRVAVRNGITDLSNIKEVYNEFAMGGNIYDGTTQNTQQMNSGGKSNYREIAKQHIRKNEGWRTNPYADGPNGWRSVGYGFNDSGFYAKYPQGISNYYAKRGGISKAEAEQELDWYLDRMESTLRKTYGKKWDSFTDNQKAAIMDTAYQKPASVDAKSAFYNAVMSGNPNAVNYLGVAKYDDRNADRRNLFNSSSPIIQENISMPLQVEPPVQQSSLSYADYNLFAPNMYTSNGNIQQQPLSTYARNLLEGMAEKEALAQRQAEKAQQKRNTQFVLDFVSSMGRGRRSSSELSNRMSPLFNMLASSGNMFDDGGGIRRMYDADTGELGSIVRVDDAGNYLVDYNGDVRPMIYQGPEYTVTGKYNREKLTEEEKENIALAKVMEMRENRHLDDPLIVGELKDNQYNTKVPQWMVDHYADMIAEQTAPGILDMIEGGVMLPQQLLSPSHWAGVIRNWDSDKGWDNIWEPNSGFVSREYAEEHPWKTMGINMVGDIIAGEVGKDILNGVRIGRNIMDRNKFVYKYLEPASYYNIKDRAKNVVNHILHDKSFAKGEIPEKVEDIGLPLEFRMELNSTPAIGIFRDESLRKYLGLPERLGLYIDNGDGTWRYNKDVVKRVLKENGINITDEELEKFPALINPSRFLRRMADAVEDGKNADIDILDFLTSSGGNSKMKFKGRKPTWVQDEYGTDIGTAWEYSADLEDPWDVNPFAPWNEGITGPSLSTTAGDYVREKADDLYTSLYDLLYKHQFANDYLGGKFLNDIRYTFDISNYPKLKKMLDKIGEKEVGKILGGEPFMMRTPVTFKKWQGKDRPIIFDFDY